MLFRRTIFGLIFDSFKRIIFDFGHFPLFPTLVFEKWPNSRLEKGKLLERVRRKAAGLSSVLTGYS